MAGHSSRIMLRQASETRTKVTEASLPVMNEIPLIPLSVNKFFVWAMSRSVETTELCAHAA